MWIYVGPRLWSSGKSVVHAVRVRHMSWFRTLLQTKAWYSSGERVLGEGRAYYAPSFELFV